MRNLFAILVLLLALPAMGETALRDMRRTTEVVVPAPKVVARDHWFCVPEAYIGADGFVGGNHPCVYLGIGANEPEGKTGTKTSVAGKALNINYESFPDHTPGEGSILVQVTLGMVTNQADLEAGYAPAEGSATVEVEEHSATVDVEDLPRAIEGVMGCLVYPTLRDHFRGSTGHNNTLAKPYCPPAFLEN